MNAKNYSLRCNSKKSLRKPERSQRLLWGDVFNQSQGRRLRDVQISPLWCLWDAVWDVSKIHLRCIKPTGLRVCFYTFNLFMHCCKMAKHTLKILKSMFGHFATLCMKGWNLYESFQREPFTFTILFLLLLKAQINRQIRATLRRSTWRTFRASLFIPNLTLFYTYWCSWQHAVVLSVLSNFRQFIPGFYCALIERFCLGTSWHQLAVVLLPRDKLTVP